MSWFDSKSDKQKSGKILKPEQQQRNVPDAITSANINNLNRNGLITLLQMKEAPKFQQDLVTFLQQTIGNQAVCQLLKEAGLIGGKTNNSGVNSSAEKIKSNIENISGVSLSDVKVRYNSNQPSQLGALAFTKGNEIHVAPGQEMHLPHEMWHAVQQKQGRVRPTGSIKGNAVNRSAALEKEADVMGARALSSAGKSAPLNSAKTNEPVAKVETREVKNGSNKSVIQREEKLSDIYKENDRVVVAFLHKIGDQFNVAQREFMAINRNLIDSDKYYLMKRMDYESGKDRNALGEEYRAAREKYDSLSAILSLSIDIMKWSHVQIAKNKLAVTEEDIINNLDKIANNRAVFNTILMGLTVIMGSVNQTIYNKINTKSISGTKSETVKEPVGGTVKSGGIKNFDDISKNPKSLWGKSSSEVKEILGEGWTQGVYGKTGTGWKFIKDDMSVFYHEGGRHGGAYYGISSGALGKIKIVGEGYIPLPGDKATIINIY